MVMYGYISLLFNKFKSLTLERPMGGGGSQIDIPIGFPDLKFETFKQSKWNFQYL